MPNIQGSNFTQNTSAPDINLVSKKFMKDLD